MKNTLKTLLNKTNTSENLIALCDNLNKLLNFCYEEQFYFSEQIDLCELPLFSKDDNFNELMDCVSYDANNYIYYDISEEMYSIKERTK